MREIGMLRCFQKVGPALQTGIQKNYLPLRFASFIYKSGINSSLNPIISKETNREQPVVIEPTRNKHYSLYLKNIKNERHAADLQYT